MCNLYVPPGYERLGKVNLKGLYGGYVAPLKPGPYFKPGDALVGQWAMIPPDSPTRIPSTKDGKKRLSTNNARREGLARSWTFGGPWRRGQRCLIPAETFDEPYYPNHDPKAKSIAWRFARADGEPWMLAGLYAEWTEPGTGEIVPSYTMILRVLDVT
ncbi:SOS response-associated peptidase family protein [Polaromonas jejuensis]|uniref:SOS response-associated peptidase family protein n=1 Tax=Polaromonas jejuensis TaxID=457502 RepID=UPI00083A21DF|nr:SOS response-associated peptidase family protein [Polaromonas jejuensis]